MKIPARLAAGSAIAALAATLAPLPGATAAPVPGATAWAAFSTADPWVAPGDNVHWYVSSQPITAAMVGRPVRITVTAPNRIDCPELGVGVGTGTGWRTLRVKPSSCTATKAVVSVVADKAMVGHSVSLTGWSAVTGATRADAQLPAGPLALVGTWNKKSVYVTSAPGVNEMWLGKGARARRLAAIDGELVRSVLVGHVVHTWTSLDGELHHWAYDIATDRATSTTIGQARVVMTGGPGFWVNTGGQPGIIDDPTSRDVLYDWAGNKRDQEGAAAVRLKGRLYGFTDTAAVFTGRGMVSTSVYLVPLDGSPMAVRTYGNFIKSVQIDGHSVVASWYEGSGTRTCRVLAETDGCLPV